MKSALRVWHYGRVSTAGGVDDCTRLVGMAVCVLRQVAVIRAKLAALETDHLKVEIGR